MTKDQSTRKENSRYRRYSALEKKRFVMKTYAPGSSVSQVARAYGITPSLLYQWRRLLEEGAMAGVDSKDGVVDKQRIKQLESRVKQLEGALGRSQLDNEILREALTLTREKKQIWRQPLVGEDDTE